MISVPSIDPTHKKPTIEIDVATETWEEKWGRLLEEERILDIERKAKRELLLSSFGIPVLDASETAIPPPGVIAMGGDDHAKSSGGEWLKELQHLHTNWKPPIQLIGPLPKGMRKRPMVALSGYYGDPLESRNEGETIT